MAIRKRVWTTTKGEAREKWVANYTDQSGKRRLKTFDRKKDAEGFLSRANVEISEGKHTAASASVTLAKAAEMWLDACRRPTSESEEGLEAATVASYEQQVRLHILPFIGKVRLSELSAPMLREFQARLRKGNEEAGPRSASMVKRVTGTLGTLLGYAQDHGLIARNVVRERSRRKAGKQKRHDARHKGKLKVGVDIPSPKEITAFLAVLKDPWRPILLTAISTGLRASELRGLRWADVDLMRGEIHVRQRVDFKNVAGPPKSSAGERKVPIGPMALSTLREHKASLPEGFDLVFPTAKGKSQYHSNIVKRGLIPAWIAAGVVDKAGKVKYTGLHSLRHFYASWCINRKADDGLELPPKIVQERLGHSTIAMTLDTYGHLFPSHDDSKEFAAAERALFG
jgi:integrase